jgi:formylglycine-generating enzyme required for sulfatase activity
MAGWPVMHPRRWRRLAALAGVVVITACGIKAHGDAGANVAPAALRTGDRRTFALPAGATMDFVWIPPGTFAMGSPAAEVGREDDEGPRHEVTVSRGFWLGRCEVTQGQWEAVMETNPSQSLGADRPVVYVSWDDVQQFVGKLNAAAGEAVYRLPSEAEWEYACRAGTATRWSFGDDERRLGEYAWWYGNSEGRSRPVGRKRPNPWGLCDMHGNVEEWVDGWYGPYGGEALTDPVGPPPASGYPLRLMRGGTFGNMPRNTRSAHRLANASAFRFSGVGARLLRVE